MKIHSKHVKDRVRLTVGDTTCRISPSAAARLAQQLSDASGAAIKNQNPVDMMTDLADLAVHLRGKGKR